MTGHSVTFSATLPLGFPLPSDASNNPSSVSSGNIADNPAIGPPGSTSSPPNRTVIIGVVLGGIVTLTIILVAIFLYIRRRRSLKLTDQLHSTDPIISPYRPFRSIYPRTGFGRRLKQKLNRITAGSANEQPLTGGSSPSAIEDLPPAYEEPEGGHNEHHEGGIDESEEEITYEDGIAGFCAANRDLISPELEVKLRAAQYLPESNPSDISAKLWRTLHRVGFFELRQLQRAYDRLASSWRGTTQLTDCCVS